ncbi:NADP oxidoreductase [Planctomycetota bacterium]|nr:NADP oxidoreductase [Planctomycetota bacterium]
MKPPLLLVRAADAPPETLAEYRARGGYAALERALTANSPADVLAEVAASGLRGRGGASFPTAKKWQLAAQQPGPEKFVVANGGEHEPGSNKDRLLVEKYPHTVLEGLLLCAFATGAQKGFLYLIEDMAAQIASAERAIAELRTCHLLAANILGSGFSFDVALHKAPTTYIAGEETAALNSIEGLPAKPRKKPPFPGEAGLFGKPTTVNNVETLAHLPGIVRHGGAWFAAIGTAESKGTLLFTLSNEVRRPGVYELPFGSTYRQLIEECGGGLANGRRLRAILPAMSCGFLLAEQLDVPIAYETLLAHQSSPGCGGVRIVDESTDVIVLTQQIAEFFMQEQCGQCPPCRMETNQFVHILKGVRAQQGPGYAEKLQRLADFNRKKGNCSLIEMAAAPVLSAVRVFAADFAAAAGPTRPPNQ